MDPKPDTRDRIIQTAEMLLFKQGFAGTSLNDVIKATDLSKGAFFHHFKGKDDLAHAVLKRWADADEALFVDFAEKAGALSDDPYQEAVIFVKLFEQWLAELDQPLEGCLFASFTYQSGRIEPTMRTYIKARLSGWKATFRPIFERLVAWPGTPGDITAEQLVEMYASLIEGGMLLARAMDDRDYLIRQLEQFRRYLALQFSPAEV